MMNAHELKVLRDLVENIEENDKEGTEEHDFHTDHDVDQCVLCSARELLQKYEEKKASRKFKFFCNQVKVFYRGFSSDGLIMLTLDDVDCSYRVDSARIPGWVKILTGKRRPHSAVEDIEKNCFWWRNDLTGEITENTERR